MAFESIKTGGDGMFTVGVTFISILIFLKPSILRWVILIDFKRCER